MPQMKIIQNLPKMKIKDMMQLWKNAVTILSDKKKKKMRPNAQKVLDAINEEWTRRKNEPIDPNDFFNWPSTEANVGDGSISTREWLQEGVLHYMGYKVGQTEGLSKHLRERILSEIFYGSIPPVFPHGYLDEWGNGGTPQRLQKLAETIAALTRNAKRRRDSKMEVAIDRWQQDLEYLYLEYYVEKFWFGWPTTKLL